MKIRTQLNILILGIILIPLVSIIALPLYHYATSSERRLLNGYKQIREMGEYDLSEDDWEMIRLEINNIPPTVQVAIYYDYSVLISNIPELKAGSILTPGEIWGFITSTNNEYDYPQAMYTLYARSGIRRFLDYANAAASHWMDVDVWKRGKGC